MPEQTQRPERKSVPFHASLQVKYAMTYLAVLAVVLVLMNTYPILASQDLLFRSKRDSMKSQTAVMASAMMTQEMLTEVQVDNVMTMLDSSALSRVVVTDPSGRILYDSTQKKTQRGQEEPTDKAASYRYALFQEIVLALRGYDVAYSAFRDNAFHSSAATPIIYRGMTIGAIYVAEVDAAQGDLLTGLQKNLRTISVVIVGVALVMSAFFSNMLTGRVTALLGAIRIVGEGEYGHRLHPAGKDELAHLAEEFNNLTDRLQKTEEVRRRFVSDASHELKTPLASIRLLSDSILQNREMDSQTAREFISDIQEEAERLTRITEHLLALTKLDSLPRTKTNVVDMGDTVQRVLGGLTPLAQADEVQLEYSGKRGCCVMCTADDLHQICYNLVENAIKYNRPGGRVMIKVTSDREQVMLEVGDTGLGIPEEDMSMVFNRFYRVDKARSRAAGGTGLGLSIVRDTVRRHGGWVSVSARQPEGSIFTVGFPRAEQPEEDEP